MVMIIFLNVNIVKIGVREILQNSFGLSRTIGMWMITIYTPSFAVSMPIVSKIADRYGHKKVNTLGIAVFGLGSLLCGLSNYYVYIHNCRYRYSDS